MCSAGFQRGPGSAVANRSVEASGLGQLAEILGAQHVAQDKAARLFVYRGDMYAEWLAYGNDAKHYESLPRASTSGRWRRPARS